MLKSYFPSEIGQLIEEFQDGTFRIKGGMKIQMDDKYVVVPSATGLWKILLSPVFYSYSHLPDEGYVVMGRRTLAILRAEVEPSSLPAKISLPVKNDGTPLYNGIKESKLSICSSDNPVLTAAIGGRVDGPPASNADKSVFIYVLNEDESFEATKKIANFYKSKFHSLIENFARATASPGYLTFYVFDQEEAKTFVNRKVRLPNNVSSFLITPRDVRFIMKSALSRVQSSALLNREQAPKLWGIHDEMMKILAIDPNTITATK